MRPYPLIDEIKMHLCIWASDESWKKVPAGVKDALSTALNAIRTREALKSQGMLDESENATPVSEKKKFIAIYKQKYIEYTDFECNETFGASENFVIQNLCQKLISEGTDSQEYLNWFFDEFLKEEFNKKCYGSPPTIRGVISNTIYAKFLFEKKQSLKTRKQDAANLTVKSAVMELATQYLEKSKNKEFGKKILEYTEGRMSLSKFSEIFLNLLIENKERDLVDKMRGLIGERNG